MKQQKTIRKILCIIMAIILLSGIFQITVLADENKKMNINLRVEGISRNLFFKDVEIPYTGTLTLQAALTYVNSQEESLKITGIETGFITGINGEKSGKFGGWDGWLFLVNGKEAPVGIDAYMLKNGDEVVLYYGDPYGVGMQFPQVDESKISEGIIKFTSSDTTYDENFNPTVTVNPVKGAAVTWYYGAGKSSKYTTDSNGEIKISSEQLTAGSHKLQIEKTHESGLPLVLRLANDYSIEIKKESPAPTQPPSKDDSTFTGEILDYKLDIAIIVVSLFIIAYMVFNKKHVHKK